MQATEYSKFRLEPLLDTLLDKALCIGQLITFFFSSFLGYISRLTMGYHLHTSPAVPQ
jgi:hypothetical protein